MSESGDCEFAPCHISIYVVNKESTIMAKEGEPGLAGDADRVIKYYWQL